MGKQNVKAVLLPRHQAMQKQIIMPIRLFICQTEQCYRISISLDNRFSVIQHRNPGLDQCFLQNFPFAALMLMVAADKIHGRVGHQCVNKFHCTGYICSVLMPVY